MKRNWIAVSRSGAGRYHFDEVRKTDGTLVHAYRPVRSNFWKKPGAYYLAWLLLVVCDLVVILGGGILLLELSKPAAYQAFLFVATILFVMQYAAMAIGYWYGRNDG